VANAIATAASVQGLSRSFGDVQAARDLSLAVPEGTIFGIIGPNGAGKTTTIRILMGILAADAGTINVLGESDPRRIKSRLGYLPEEKGLYKKMQVGELVAWFGQLKGMSRRDATDAARKLLTEFDLESRWRDKCDSLSKGMGQKVQIAATLVHDPELVVLDEPFSGLDPINVEMVRDAMLALKARGRTVILCTHIMEQAEQICDALALINRGRVVLDGTLAELTGSGDTLTVEYDGAGADFRRLPGVGRVNDAGNVAELSLSTDADPQAILRELLQRVTVRRFDTTTTSLHEVFVRAVREQGDEPLVDGEGEAA